MLEKVKEVLGNSSALAQDLTDVVAGAFANRFLGRASRPLMLTHTVTFGCNARCIMCDSWKKETSDDLTLEQIKAVYNKLPRMPVVRLTGGEPWYRKDFPEVLRAAEEILRPRLLHVTTNGFLTKSIVETLSNPDRRVPLDLLISLDGFGEKHDTIRGNSRAFALCMKTIETLAHNKRRWNLRVAVNQTVVDNDGANHYRILRDILKPLGVPVHIVMAYDQSATYSTTPGVNVAPTTEGSYQTFGEFDDEVLLQLFAEFEHDLQDFPYGNRVAKKYYLDGIRNRMLRSTGTPNPPCVALSSHLRILPNGDIPTCQMNSDIVGNLREQSFDEIWLGPKALANRQWVRDCEGCWAECEVQANAFFTLDIALPAGFRAGSHSRPSNSSDPDGPRKPHHSESHQISNGSPRTLYHLDLSKVTRETDRPPESSR